MDYEAWFEARADQFRTQLASVNRRLDQIAWLRLLTFVLGAAIEVWTWQVGGAWWLPGLLPLLVGFGILVKWNLRVQREKEFVETLIRINVEEPQRLEGKAPNGDGGASFSDKAHPYSGDLDLFGSRSLFALLDRSSTVFGRNALADWLLSPAERDTVLQRQQAMSELADHIDFRQHLQAEGQMPGKQDMQPDKLSEWLRAPSAFAGLAIFPRLAWILPPISLALALAAIFGFLPWLVPTAAYFGHLLINRRIWKAFKAAYQQTDRMAGILKSYSTLLDRIAKEKLDAPLNRELQAKLNTAGRPAAEEIGALAKILERLELHLNGMVYFFVNTLFFWDIHALVALEKWKGSHADKVLGWFEVLGEMEALAGIAAVRFGHPDWAIPSIEEGAFTLQATEAGHPLIPAHQRVSNPMHLPAPACVWLVTGSNMSGKSTYLRTVGVNALLALAGAPVCAQAMRLSSMNIVASMRTSDSLEENTSSFYAELKRLKQVIATVEQGRPTLFLLDEILKGTNSRDRHSGARALIRQLVKAGGAGLVSTHDIELQDLSSELPGQVLNYSFHCDVSPEGQLEFDYKLREGVCHSMNATALMRAMGIEV